MNSPDDLRSQARRYRRLATQIMDKRALQALTQLAGEYEGCADQLERRGRIRRRAHEMWEEQGSPHGLHLDHWIAAEHELSEDEGTLADGNFAGQQR